MARVRMQVITARVGDLPRDEIVNTIHFSRAGLWDAVWAGPAIDDLCEDVRDMFASTRTLIPSGYSVRTKAFNLDDALPRYPVAQTTFVPYANAAGADAPREVALCLSFRGDQNVPRKRGRIYLGPFPDGAMSGRPGVTPRNMALAIAQGLADIGGIDIDWCVRSSFPIQIGDQGGTMHAVQEAWCDDEWDTQRSRGQRATTRQTLALSE